MKKILLALLFLAAPVLRAQDPGTWVDFQDYWVDISGGDAGPVGTVSSVGISSSDNFLTVTNSPIVGAGTIDLALNGGPAGFYTNPATALMDDDFCGATRGASSLAGSGAIVNTIASGGAGHPCVRDITAGAATGSAAELYSINTGTVRAIDIGGGPITMRMIFRVSSIGDGTDVIKYYEGMCSLSLAGICAEGLGIRYDRSVSTTNWGLCHYNGSTPTCTDTGIAVVVGANWTDALVTTSSDGHTLACTINGVACAAGPTTGFQTQASSLMFKLDKTAGATTVFTLTMDRFTFVQTGITR